MNKMYSAIFLVFISFIIINCPQNNSIETLTPRPSATLKEGPLTTPDPCSIVITFPDPNLEKEIRNIINKSSEDIFLCDINTITDLDLSFKNISDISGINNFTSLTALDLNNNNIDNISPLSELISLNYLYLCGNNISDINPLSV